MKESDVQRAILEYLRYKRIFCFKNNTTGIYKPSTGSYIPSQSVGAPDIIAIVNCHNVGVMLGLEVKSPTGRLSPHQIIFKKNLEDNGAFYAVVRSIEDAEQAILNVQKEIVQRMREGVLREA